MFRHSIPIGRIFGISVDLDYSWFLVLGLITWVLAASYYPAEIHLWSQGGYWLLGAITAVLLFVSVLVHELGHSLLARRFGISVPRITLFIFGGVSQFATEPASATAEFWISVVGPIVSFVLAAIFWGLEHVLIPFPPAFEVAKYLAFLNFILGIFNLIPGFPLDGGRVLRAIVWKSTGKYQQATSIAATVGRFFGFLLIFFGVWQAISGNLFGGLWIAFIGWFLESAAGNQLQQQVVKNLLGEHKVLDAMQRDFPRIASVTTLQELVDRHILTGAGRYFVATGSGGPEGLVTLAAVRHTPRSAWATTRVSDVMVPLQKMDATAPEARLWSALEKMGRDGVNQLPVLDGNQIVGVLSREDILHYLNVARAFSS